MRLEETAEILAIFFLEFPDHGKENSASSPVTLVQETGSESRQKSKMVTMGCGLCWELAERVQSFVLVHKL